ncbi:MAG: ABC transporter ATP-binding protein [Desulfobacterales bacterium]|nr:ABC transporter ATP-binding protein [Desulfobacterales bacterium]
MSGTAITIENLGKKYIISHQAPERYTALRDVIANKAKKMTQNILSPFRKIESDSSKEEFWALKDVSFEVKQGEVIGIIGRNGAGKTTLLKILSRITEPTTGRFRIKGRVSSLLEVGTGFHPELTGRENIFLNGAILGMGKAEIKRKFDEIVTFAEIEKFLDTPVKRYSSGMYVRLAFAVAAHLEPEILIVDEVLAVGDAQFQKKCLGKMGDVAKEGRTVLFVSHNMAALKSLCEKAIWLNGGTVIENGYAEDVVSNYLQNNMSVNMDRVWDDPETAPGNKKVSLHSVKISYEGEKEAKSITVATPIDLEFEFWNYEPGSLINLSVVLYDNQDVCIFNTCSDAIVYPAGKVKSVCHIPGNFMNDGIYRVRLLIVKDQSVALVDLDNIASFEVHDAERKGVWYGKWIGTVRPKFNWDSFYIG